MPERRSSHADEFNHDPWANQYDRSVRNESDPIRTGYAALLEWTIEQAAISADDVVIDLGIGTGNAYEHVEAAHEIFGVDLSEKMIEIAKSKIGDRLRVQYFVSDILEFFATPRQADVVISTYTIHHLTSREKAQLFADIARSLPSGGRAVFGDLMFESATDRAIVLEEFVAQGYDDLAKDIEEEFFWQIDEDRPALEAAGLEVREVRRFSTLSWGIATVKGDASS